jgi:hypothetical protein
MDVCSGQEAFADGADFFTGMISRITPLRGQFRFLVGRVNTDPTSTPSGKTSASFADFIGLRPSLH